jgi:hypothetical protein
LAVSYLLLRLGWPAFRTTKHVRRLLDHPDPAWASFSDVLRMWPVR